MRFWISCSISRGSPLNCCWLNVRIDVNLAVLGLLALGVKDVAGDCSEVDGLVVIGPALTLR